MRHRAGVYFGNVPTAPDVEKLMALNAEPGMIIEYEDIERLIGVRRSQGRRFYTVTNAWRAKLLREKALRVVPEGEAFKVLSPEETLAVNIKGAHSVRRGIARHSYRCEMANIIGLSDSDLKKHMLLLRGSRALLASAEDVCKRVAPPSPSPIKTYRRLAPPILMRENVARHGLAWLGTARRGRASLGKAGRGAYG